MASLGPLLGVCHRLQSRGQPGLRSYLKVHLGEDPVALPPVVWAHSVPRGEVGVFLCEVPRKLSLEGRMRLREE